MQEIILPTGETAHIEAPSLKVSRPWSPSALSTAAGGCPAKLHDYRSKAQKVPNEALHRGSAFHRLAEAAQRLVLDHNALPGQAVERAIADGHASQEQADLLWKWCNDGCLIMNNVIGIEIAMGLDANFDYVDFRDPSAILRFIMDRFEVYYAEDTEQPIIKVIDWKSGYSDWTAFQQEVYILGADAYARHHNIAEDADTIETWVYTPAAKRHESESFSRDEETLEPLREKVRRAIQAAERVASQDPCKEKLGPACTYCDRKPACEAFAAVPYSVPEVETPAQALEALEKWVASKEATDYLAKRLQGYVKRYGFVKLEDGREYGRHANDRQVPDPIPVWRDILARVLPGVDGMALDLGAEALAAIVPPMSGNIAAAKRALKLGKDYPEGWTKPTVEHRWELKCPGETSSE